MKIVELLIENGALVNAVNDANESALLVSIYAGKIIDMFKNVCIKETSFLCKKSRILFSGFSKITELLIQKNANVNVVGRDGKTALIWSAEQGEKSERFFEGINFYKSTGITKLYIYILVSPFYLFTGFFKSVQLMIEKGANVNAVDDEKKSALVYAVEKGKFA